MNDINFADIQQEINQAEQYLQSKQFNGFNILLIIFLTICLNNFFFR